MLSDARRPLATRGISAFAPVCRALDNGIPVALPMAVAAAIQGVRRVITSGSSSSSIGERIQLPNLECGRWAKIVLLALQSPQRSPFCFGPGHYLGARPSVDPQHELAALRADIDLLRKQQELAPTRAAGISPPPTVVDAHGFDPEKRAAIVADVKRQLQTEMGLLPLTLIRDRRHSFVELYSYDDRDVAATAPPATLATAISSRSSMAWLPWARKVPPIRVSSTPSS